MQRVKSPNGREWELRATRFRLRPWQRNVYDPMGVAPTMDLLWAVSGVVPLVLFVFELPIALVRGMFDRGRWIEAVCRYPETRITWRVANRRELWWSFIRIQDHLTRGSERLESEGVKIVAITPPAALRDLLS